MVDKEKRNLWSDSEENNTADILKHIKTAEKILESHSPNIPIKNYDYDEIDEMLFEFETVSVQLRKEIENKNNNENLLFAETDNGYLVDRSEHIYKSKLAIAKEEQECKFPNYPASFKFNGELVEIFMPLTFKRGYKKKNYIKNYLVSKYINALINDWQNKNQIDLFRTVQAPYIIVMKRTAKKFNVKKICDADNLENQRIINVITRAFHLPDNQQFMSLFTIFDEVEFDDEVGTYFYVFAEKDLDKYKYLLKKKDKEQVKNTIFNDIKSKL